MSDFRGRSAGLGGSGFRGSLSVRSLLLSVLGGETESAILKGFLSDSSSSASISPMTFSWRKSDRLCPVDSLPIWLTSRSRFLPISACLGSSGPQLHSDELDANSGKLNLHAAEVQESIDNGVPAQRAENTRESLVENAEGC